MPEIPSEIPSINLLALASFLTQREPKKFPDTEVLRNALRAEARNILQQSSQKVRPAIGMLKLAHALRRSEIPATEITAVLMGEKPFSGLLGNNMPQNIYEETPCSSEELAKFLAKQS